LHTLDNSCLDASIAGIVAGDNEWNSGRFDNGIANGVALGRFAI
jgi:hypothetical protein